MLLKADWRASARKLSFLMGDAQGRSFVSKGRPCIISGTLKTFRGLPRSLGVSPRSVGALPKVLV
jgi:hypothetical protein